MFVTALGCRTVERTQVYQTREGEQTNSSRGAADGVKQIDSYRCYDTDSVANTEWYTFLMLISARQMSERVPAGKLENEQKSEPATASPPLMRHNPRMGTSLLLS